MGCPYERTAQNGDDDMFLEYISDMLFVLIAIIGGIVAIFYAYLRKTKKRRAR